MISILGSSGSGKSTLLRCINLLERPDAGIVYFLLTFILTRVFYFSERRHNRYLMPMGAAN